MTSKNTTTASSSSTAVSTTTATTAATTTKTLALTNATGRQAASLARSASAVGYRIVAHINGSQYNPLVAAELEDLPNTRVLTGRLGNAKLRAQLFEGADLAFVNTTNFDDEYDHGKACIDAARAAGVKHLVYSSMPDHAAAPPSSKGKGGSGWDSLPHWAPKWHVEEYARGLAERESGKGMAVTFVHTGIYYNNFTSLPYPLFCLRKVPWEEVLRWDGDWEADWVPERNGRRTKGEKCGFEWQAPFPPDVKLPWLDCEHDFGPCVLQILKGGPERWKGRRIPVAFCYLDPPTVCAAFSRALNRPVRYIEAPVEIQVPVPKGYKNQLDALQKLFGGDEVKGKRAPYWWPEMFDATGILNEAVDEKDAEFGKDDDEPLVREEEEENKDCLTIARKIWAGWRDIEGYARDVFPVEEKLNGLTWMKDSGSQERKGVLSQGGL